MISAPWYLLAAGIALFLLGCFIAALTKPAGPPMIDPRMRDKDIARQLQRQEQGGSVFGSLLIVLGVACIGASIVWRLIRAAMAFAT